MFIKKATGKLVNLYDMMMIYLIIEIYIQTIIDCIQKKKFWEEGVYLWSKGKGKGRKEKKGGPKIHLELATELVIEV